ncbi:T-box transcription factor TBX6-like [Eupeodes corollae]|uniref:T-box transcription factor TBX6-like n=1 Tax=Eupeodes corollae TaxID=290404 RepID=UPI0024917B11|nr:T-box transcription factor TBX6-like [Eupeodes corollae]
MITMNEFVDLRMQQHIAHEIYRHQIMQRIPDPFPPLLPIPIPRHIILPPRVSLPGVEATLQNDDLWKQFHQIGTEMIITKSGRRMFPSMRLSISGLEEESNYCVLLEMVPIGDCRYKFSGSQWVPAGGAEPQSPQRMFLHTDSPASGAHWQAQPILFNKVKLTNNTLDSNGHIVLASMHKYQPRIHIIRTSDPTQIPWSPQQAFVFPETEFVAVTAYQNDRITKLKIDNNPFAKGFRETGQSRCKRKMSSSPEIRCTTNNDTSPLKLNSLPSTSGCDVMNAANEDDHESSPNVKRMRSNGSTCSMSSLDEVGFPTSTTSSNSTSGKNSPNIDLVGNDLQSYQHPSPRINMPNDALMVHKMQTFMNPSFADLAYSYFERPQYPMHMHSFGIHHQQPNEISLETSDVSETEISNGDAPIIAHQPSEVSHSEAGGGGGGGELLRATKSKNFSISAILGSKS